MDYKPTKKLHPEQTPAAPEFTRLIRPGGRPQGPPAPSPETRMVDRDERPAADDDARTVLHRPSKASRSAPAKLASATGVADSDQTQRDPVAGWLAVVAGPGEGNFVALGFGVNTLGRDADQRCRIDFGDNKISRKAHTMVTYDPENRKFYVQHGGGQNLTYLGSQPVLSPTQLNGGEFIRLGETVLRFVPLCGPDFDYGEHNKA